MDELTKVLSSLSIPSCVAAIIGLIAFLLKQKPITLLTSSSIEKLLYSKEKKIVIEVLLYLVHSSISTLILSYFTWVMYYFNFHHSLFISIPALVFITSGFLYFSINNVNKKDFRQVFGSKSKNAKLVIILICLGYIVLVYFLAAYFLASEVLRSIEFKASELEMTLSTVLFALLFSLCVTLPLVKTTTKFIGDNGMPSLYIKEGDQMWYIYHYVDQDKFLFGDHPKLEQSKKFIIRDRIDVLKSFVLYKVEQENR